MPEGTALAVHVILFLPDTFPGSSHVLFWLLYITGISTSVSLAIAFRVLLLAAHSIFLSLWSCPPSPPLLLHTAEHSTSPVTQWHYDSLLSSHTSQSSGSSENKPFRSQFNCYSYQAITGWGKHFGYLDRLCPWALSFSACISVTSSHLCDACLTPLRDRQF